MKPSLVIILLLKLLKNTIKVKQKIIKPYDDKGYYKVVLNDINRNKQNAYFVSRLVAINFIPNLKAHKLVAHKDGDKSNNKESNLMWVTRAYYNSKIVKSFNENKCNARCT